MTAVLDELRAGPPRWLASLRSAEPLLLLLRASLIVVVINSNDDPPVFVATALVAFVALPRPTLLHSPWLWAALFSAIGARQLATWHTIDDHIIATTYWCGALALGLTARDRRATLAASARLLVGVLFAFAAGWKLRSGEFVDGSFFRYTFLFDDRFETVARLAGGTTETMRDANLDRLGQLDATGVPGQIPLTEGPRNSAVAAVFTTWGFLVEAAVALAFLVPLRPRWEWLRHGSLTAFAATTYAVVPIGGFGTLLLVLGAAQATAQRARTAYYLGALALMVWGALWPLVLR